MYLDKANGAQLYELKRKVHNTRQASMSVTAYYNEINRIWQEMDTYQDYEWKNVKDGVLFKPIHQKDKVFGFLKGLNP